MAWRCWSKIRVKTAASSRLGVIFGHRDLAELLPRQQLQDPDELLGRDQLAEEGDLRDLLPQQLRRHVGIDLEPSHQRQGQRLVHQLEEGAPEAFLAEEEAGLA